MVRFDKKWFNPLYFILNDILKDDNIRTVLVYGGKSSSKTVSIAQLLIKEAFVNEHSTIAFRKESATIKTTLKKSFNLGIDTMYMSEAFEKLEFEYRGAGYEIVLKGLDNEEKAKGIESYKYVYLDELNHFTPGEFTQFQMSLRGIKGQKIFASWNPVDETSWVKTDVVDQNEYVATEWSLPCPNSFVKISTDGKTVLIKTTWEDNFWTAGGPNGEYGFRDENLIAVYDKLKTTNYNAYRVNVLGEWGKAQTGQEFYYSFRPEVNTTDQYVYDPNFPIWLSWDENVNPYLSCLITQIKGSQINVIGEITAKHPNNTVAAACSIFRRSFPMHKAGLIITGDATSNKQDVKIEKGFNFFKLIANELATFKPQIRTPPSNPSVYIRGLFVNAVLGSNYGAIDVNIYKECKHTIDDLLYVKQAPDGTKHKEMAADEFKIRSQKYGHLSDCLDYLICEAFKNEYLRFQKGDGATASFVGLKSYNKKLKF